MKEFLDYVLIDYDNFTIKVYTLLQIFIVFIIVRLLLFLIKTGINKSSKFDVAKKYSVYQLIKYVAYVLTAIAFFHILGFNVSYLLLGSSALLVGLGFGLQNLFSDFISGIILLIDSSVKVGDVIEVDGLIGQVVQIDFRTTMVITRDDKYIIVPNTDLTKNQLVNWTHAGVLSRFEVKIGVSYNSDVSLVIILLKEATLSHTAVEKSKEPIIRFSDFGDSSLNFTVLFWSSEVFRIENVKSDIRIKIFELFNQNKIEIPFPQRVLHTVQ
ncbi:mechanosensitive ion channel family protein [Flavobacterium capsici]|uniref:Mechanosensitive ion channel n=1 Tax=Flavobacterium capsici TaxID=3075618 RepID=A0AA96EZ39_9FLAO|nr:MULTISPECIES: mechanosensitive ion channel domain-containing protein [unclassified Flavobacterium]WNM18281.1 mechanosensitive ion channel [Flavobacterium sp. PMR2A8]WNM22332.1 mechanosensitive ion channel [Flavobacterium sp. PMTSA4]